MPSNTVRLVAALLLVPAFAGPAAADKIANPVAVFSGLDKITGRITSFDVYIDETVQFGALQVTPRACYTRPPTEDPQTDAFVEVDEITLTRKVQRIFTGWMFASSPGLHAVEHPVYDIWLTDCKGGVTTDVPAPPIEVKPAKPKPGKPAAPPPVDAPAAGDGFADPGADPNAPVD